MSSPMAALALNASQWKSRSGNIGRARWSSMATKAAPAAAATPYPTSTVALANPCAPPSIVAAASSVRQVTAVSCPGASMPRSGERLVSAAQRAVSTIPATPIGALMKKIARQPSAAVRMPPTSGPADSAALAPRAHRPIARLRSRASG